MVVGGQDTGYQWDHPALKAKYRGWNGATADHNYNWHDAIHADTPTPPPGTPAASTSTAPCDDHGHGTHTMGTMVGDDGGANQVGMAPGAKWISCRNMEQGWRHTDDLHRVLPVVPGADRPRRRQPRPQQGARRHQQLLGLPDRRRAATAATSPTMSAAVESLRAAGVAVVVSAGNSGSGCSSVNTPAAIFDSVITVGNTTSTDTIAGSSSRGPVTVDGSNRRKPDISAPGTCVRSSVPTDSYSAFSRAPRWPARTSPARWRCSSRPIRRSAAMSTRSRSGSSGPRCCAPTTAGCGGDSTTIVPNNTFGWGRLDVLKAVTTLLADDFEPTTFGRWDLVCPGGVGCV